jgi:hypothetical protein
MVRKLKKYFCKPVCEVSAQVASVLQIGIPFALVPPATDFLPVYDTFCSQDEPCCEDSNWIVISLRWRAKMEQQNRGARALVLGGSIGGLLAARVLADHYERVTHSHLIQELGQVL